jgi:hypothetical protein
LVGTDGAAQEGVVVAIGVFDFVSVIHGEKERGLAIVGRAVEEKLVAPGAVKTARTAIKRWRLDFVRKREGGAGGVFHRGIPAVWPAGKFAAGR